MGTRKALALFLLFGLGLPHPAVAGELSISHAATERLLNSWLLAEGGRLYLDGSPADSCRYAFVQEPKVSGGGGRLSIRFVFSGRAGATVAGRCVGPGDTLDISASGVPYFAAGELRLADLRLQAPDSAYFKVAAGPLQSQLERRLRVPIRARLEEALALASIAATVRLTLNGFEVPAIAVDEQGLQLTVEERVQVQ